jgi:phage FluMu protein Com
MTSSTKSDDLRCACGCLMARLTAGHLELKCRRCKRVYAFRIKLDAAEPSPAGPCCGDVEMTVVE